MSTRATYEFRSEYKSTTIYIHHDGYPQGAASYLYNAFSVDGHLTPESMIRGNERAEITESHDLHGDTEYRYTIEGSNIKVEERHTLVEFGSYPKGWGTIFNGDWVDFINQNVCLEWVDNFKPLKRLKVAHHEKAYTPDQLAKQLTGDLELCGRWTASGVNSPESANMKSLVARITTMQNALKAYSATPEWNE